MISKDFRISKQIFLQNKPKVFYRGDFCDGSVFLDVTGKRVTVIIAKKRLKRAVDRNRVKRVVYEAVRVVNPTFSKPVIIYPKAIVLTAPFSVICSEISALFATLR